MPSTFSTPSVSQIPASLCFRQGSRLVQALKPDSEYRLNFESRYSKLREILFNKVSNQYFHSYSLWLNGLRRPDDLPWESEMNVIHRSRKSTDSTIRFIPRNETWQKVRLYNGEVSLLLPHPVPSNDTFFGHSRGGNTGIDSSPNEPSNQSGRISRIRLLLTNHVVF
nr:hypothetical protein Iba_chr11eCG8840 [Ipomoea batatas]